MCLAAGALMAVVGYHQFLRPRHLHWGATLDEVLRPMPGDSAVPHPYIVTTRAVTIRAAPRDVWPWLVQIGDQRGGLYSYDWLDRLFGFTSHRSADTVLPEFQHPSVGDVIPMGRGPSWPITVVQPEHALVVEPVPSGVTWCFELHAADQAATRLVSRVRTRVWSKEVLWLLAPFVDGAWFLMERKMLLGIKQRAEALSAQGVQA
jgi:hypothetical protein